MPEILETQEAPVFSYIIASADMRYIEVGEREIYLRNNPKAGLIYQGEIPGCGPGCHIDLSAILLEYVMSCEGCKEQGLALKEVVRFGEQLGDILAARTQPELAGLSASTRLASVFKCVLNSMHATFTEETKGDYLEYSLECCPVSDCAESSGHGRSVELALSAFVALCNSLVKTLAPDWVLSQPSPENATQPIHKIVLTNKSVH